MGLRLRRGTNTQRQAVTFAEGELIFVTDYVTAGVSPLWIGDGSTVGGKEVETSGTPSLTLDDLTDVVIPAPGAGENEVLAYVGGQWTNTDPASLGISGPLDGLTDVNVPAPAQNNVLAYVGSEWTSVAPSTLFNAGITEGTEYNISINGSVIGADSSIIVDNVTQVVRANLFVGSGAGLTDINLVDLDDVFAFGAVENDVLTYNGTGWIPLPSQGIELGQTYDISIEGNVLGTDSSIIVNASTGVITGDLIGNVTGNVTGTVVGNVNGDLKGSVFGDDSTILVDGVNGLLTGTLQTSQINFPVEDVSGFVRIEMVSSASEKEAELRILSLDDRASIRLTHVATTDLSADSGLRGLIRFEKSDTVDTKTIGFFGMGNNYFKISVDENGLFPDTKVVHFENGNFGIGIQTPTETLHAIGNGLFTGDVTASAFKGSVVADDSTILVDAVNGSIPGYIRISELKTALQDGSGDYAAFKSWILSNL